MRLRPLGTGELRLLRRLVINPSMKQADLANSLDVSRSAVNQIWKKLQRDFDISIRSTLDYGRIGFLLIFGWAKDKEGSPAIPKFKQWLSSHALTSIVAESVLSSMMDKRIYFEAFLPPGRRGRMFLEQLSRFQKRPYNLSITYGISNNVTNNMNLGLFDGRKWEVIDGFKFGAIIDSARSYADILPDVLLSRHTHPVQMNVDDLLVASSLEENYHTTSRELQQRYEEFGYSAPSERTLRRRLDSMRRSHTVPYVSIRNVGLNQRFVVCLREQKDQATLTRLLQAQATTLPKARVVKTEDITAMILDLPESASWFAISKAFSELASDTLEMCTFIAESAKLWNGLASLVPPH
ncbi:MAG: winged helix-turn-helix domain-containing protein [Candidatus Thorarchaeota archaeon]|jgi:hypothetical protein